MLARLDNLPQRHRSVTLHAAAPDVDFRSSMRCEKIPGRHDPCSRNSPVRACHAKPPAIGISLAEIAGITRSWQRPARAEPRDWHNACGNCRNPRHGPPDRYLDRIEGRAERAERLETHFLGPMAVRKYSWGRHSKEKGHDCRPARQARRQFRGPTGIGGRGFYGAHLLREAVAKPREQSENSQSFQCRKAANPGQWCLLIPAFCVPRF
jgi:hypothetical protein